uniref:Uncharacterized protein n=1 Tax=Eutreptiella gymnastica TaxID=73025 RepID=A0A7S4FS46_9EUGL
MHQKIFFTPCRRSFWYVLPAPLALGEEQSARLILTVVVGKSDTPNYPLLQTLPSDPLTANMATAHIAGKGGSLPCSTNFLLVLLWHDFRPDQSWYKRLYLRGFDY